MSQIFTVPRWTPVDGNGIPLAGAKLYFYLTGSSTPLNTYSDYGLTTANTNPVVADTNGLFGPIYLGSSGNYKIQLTTSAGVAVWTIDPYPASTTNTRSAVNDVNYAVLATDGIVAYTALTAARTITLPAASTFSASQRLVIIDEAGTATGTITLSLIPNGTDKINGVNATTVVVNSAFGAVELECNGSNGWFYVSKAPVIEQVLSTITGAVATGTTKIPLDDTIPQITEGDQYMSLAITPRSAANKLVIDVVCNMSPNTAAGDNVTAALFQDLTANALAATSLNLIANASAPIMFRYVMLAGTVAATTFKVRAGGSAGGVNTFTFNGTGATRLYGGVMASSITIREVAQ